MHEYNEKMELGNRGVQIYRGNYAIKNNSTKHLGRENDHK